MAVVQHKAAQRLPGRHGECTHSTLSIKMPRLHLAIDERVDVGQHCCRIESAVFFRIPYEEHERASPRTVRRLWCDVGRLNHAGLHADEAGQACEVIRILSG